MQYPIPDQQDIIRPFMSWVWSGDYMPWGNWWSAGTIIMGQWWRIRFMITDEVGESIAFCGDTLNRVLSTTLLPFAWTALNGFQLAPESNIKREEEHYLILLHQFTFLYTHLKCWSGYFLENCSIAGINHLQTETLQCQLPHASSRQFKWMWGFLFFPHIFG